MPKVPGYDYGPTARYGRWLGDVYKRQAGECVFGMENDNKPVSQDNWGQIIRKDAKGCFVEVRNDTFHLDKVHLQFVSYDTTKPKGSRYVNNISIYIDVPEFLALAQEAASGALHMRMQQYKNAGNKDPLYEHLGGTAAKYLTKYGRPRPDGKSLSRVVRLTVAAKSDYFLTADSGPGEENKTGLIVPRFGTKPEQHVSVILSWRQLNELLLTTVEHYRAWLAAKYASEWATVHAQRASGRDRVRGEQGRAPNSAAPAPEPKPPAPAAPAQKAPAQQAGFASAFGSVYGSGNGKSGAGDRKMF